jgi:hypothetical protein
MKYPDLPLMMGMKIRSESRNARMMRATMAGPYRSQKKITQMNVINAEIARIQRTSDSVMTITQTSSSPPLN